MFSPGSSDQTNKELPVIKKLCKSKILVVRVVYLSFLWFTLNIVYFGIGFGLGKLEGDIYINGIISGGSQSVGYLVCGLLMMYVGRRQITVVSFLLSGIPLCIYSFIHSNVILSYILVLLGKFGISSSFNVIFVWSVQLFPTQVKGVAFAFCNLFGRIGGILAPLISGVIPNWFLLILGVFSIIAACVSLLLAETKGKEIPDVIEEEKSESIVMKVEEV